MSNETARSTSVLGAVLFPVEVCESHNHTPRVNSLFYDSRVQKCQRPDATKLFASKNFMISFGLTPDETVPCKMSHSLS